MDFDFQILFSTLKDTISDAWTLSNFADLFGVIGFGLTISIALAVKRLHQFYGFQGRGPAILKDVKKYKSAISDLLNSKELEILSAQVPLRQCQSTLKSLRRFIPPDQKKIVKDAQKSIKKAIANKNGLLKENVREVYGTLVTVEADIDNIIKDSKWRTPQ